MDDKLGHWNWTKLVRLGMSTIFAPGGSMLMHCDEGTLLAKKYLNAVEQAEAHAQELLLINKALPQTLIESWTTVITTWENDRTAPNPYYIPATSA